MTDEDLIAALGWEPCRYSALGWCGTHDDIARMGVDASCEALRNQLIGARAGIDLARSGIGAKLRADADRLDQEAEGSDAPGPLMVAATYQRRAVVMAEGWQP